MGQRFVPERGDLVWLHFNPQSGHEQAGRRPAVILSRQNYNRKTSLGLFCPITSKIKGYPFEVVLPGELPVSGVVLADQIKSLDWPSRKAELICSLPEETIAEVLGKALALLK